MLVIKPQLDPHSSTPSQTVCWRVSQGSLEVVVVEVVELSWVRCCSTATSLLFSFSFESITSSDLKIKLETQSVHSVKSAEVSMQGVNLVSWVGHSLVKAPIVLGRSKLVSSWALTKVVEKRTTTNAVVKIIVVMVVVMVDGGVTKLTARTMLLMSASGRTVVDLGRRRSLLLPFASLPSKHTMDVVCLDRAKSKRKPKDVHQQLSSHSSRTSSFSFWRAKMNEGHCSMRSRGLYIDSHVK